MRRQRFFILPTLLLVLGISAAQGQRNNAASTQPDEPTSVVNANVVNVRDGRVTPNATIVLRDGRIASIGIGAPPADGHILDLRGTYVLPGLIDAHTHADTFAGFRTALESGVTTLRSAGVFGSGYTDVGFRELVKRGAVIGPNVVTAGYQIRPRLQEEAFLANPQYADLMSGLDTIEKLRRAVQMNLAHGVEWIKILATPSGASPDPRHQNFTEDEIRAIVDEAAAKGVPVEAHVHSDQAAMAAVKAGVRSIEHGENLSDETLSLMKAKGVYLDPTYTVLWSIAEPGGDPRTAAFGTPPDPALRLRALAKLPQARDTIARAHKMGLKIVTGTDLNYGPRALPRISLEMAHFVEMGFTPFEAIQAATIVNAELLRLEKSIGALDVGYKADLLVVQKNPLENIVTIQDPLLVICNGKVAVDRMNVARVTP
jgi:imidazolonepropionase-like amidohydrolase